MARRIPRPDSTRSPSVPAGTVRRIAVTIGGVQAPGSPITNEGTIALPEYPTGAAAHAASHQDGGADEINVAGLSGELADPQPPKTHTHTKSEVTDFAHTHPQSDVTDLVTDLGNKQPLAAILTALASLTDAAGFLENDGAGALSWGAGGGGGGATDASVSLIKRTTDQALTTSVFNAVSFDQALNNAPAYYSAAQPTRLTAPTSGFYLIGGAVRVDISAAGNIYLQARINGVASRYGVTENTEVANAYLYAQTSGVLYLNAGDYVELGIFPSVAATLKFEVGSVSGHQVPIFYMMKLSGSLVSGLGGTSVSFTPTITFATPGNLSVAYTTQIGKYVRIGDKVFVDIVLDFTPTHTTASGAFRIEGLPFTIAAAEPRSTGALVLAYVFAQPTSTKHQFCIAIEGTNYLQLGVSADGAAGSSTFITTQFPTATNRFLRATIAYTAVHDDAYNLAAPSGTADPHAWRTDDVYQVPGSIADVTFPSSGNFDTAREYLLEWEGVRPITTGANLVMQVYQSATLRTTNYDRTMAHSDTGTVITNINATAGTGMTVTVSSAGGAVVDCSSGRIQFTPGEQANARPAPFEFESKYLRSTGTLGRAFGCYWLSTPTNAAIEKLKVFSTGKNTQSGIFILKSRPLLPSL